MLNKASIFLLLAGLGMLSCSKDPISDLSTEESLVYITNHDKSADFKTYKTFSITDSVLVIENNQAGTALTDIDRDVLQRIITNMEQLGYKYVSPKSKPDVGLNVAWVTNTYTNLVSTPSYWGGYWGGGGWGYGYPNYYSYYQTSESYWMVSMLDFKNPNTSDQTYDVIWNAQIRGSGIGDRQFVNTMVDSAFGQSGYLKIN